MDKQEKLLKNSKANMNSPCRRTGTYKQIKFSEIVQPTDEEGHIQFSDTIMNQIQMISPILNMEDKNLSWAKVNYQK